MIPLKDDNPTSTFPYVTVAIIAVNAAVFLYQLTLGRDAGEVFIYRTAAIPSEISSFADVLPLDYLPPPLTPLTAMFVHGGLLHVGGNMLYLWIFGDNIEDVLGHGLFAVFYLVTGVLASLTHVLTDPGSAAPMVGASGAIAGVLGAYFVLFPKAKVNTLVFLGLFVSIIKIPAVFFLVFWFLMQLLGAGAGGGIAWFAHIGGFASGALLITLFKLAKGRSRHVPHG
ncbi:MAG: rhomboid family intramembrane serine protease [Deltaproteobacteria bacterium]|nr:rhomboid family intramembrane serine protease [Deltaproteobacteria bacterium]